MASITYKACVKQQRLNNEDNDCSVKALSIVTNKPYAEAHAALKAQGRKNKRGATVHQILRALRTLGFDVVNNVPEDLTDAAAVEEWLENSPQHKYNVKTATTATNLPKEGRRFLCVTCNHIFAVTNGVVQDWTEGRRNRVNTVFEVVRTERKPRHKAKK